MEESILLLKKKNAKAVMEQEYALNVVEQEKLSVKIVMVRDIIQCIMRTRTATFIFHARSAEDSMIMLRGILVRISLKLLRKVR